MAFSSLLGGVYAGSVKTAGDAKALADAKYTDVGGGDWYAEAVGQATAQGLFTGTSGTTFAPAGTTTRGMLVTVLHRGLLLRRCGGLGRRARRDLRHLRRRLLPQRRPDP